MLDFSRHLDDGWAPEVERLVFPFLSFAFIWMVVICMWMTAHHRSNDGSLSFGWHFWVTSPSSMTIQGHLDDGLPSSGWRFAFIWMIVHLHLGDTSFSGWCFTFSWMALIDTFFHFLLVGRVNRNASPGCCLWCAVGWVHRSRTGRRESTRMWRNACALDHHHYTARFDTRDPVACWPPS